MEKLAIIGSGIAGMGCAHFLHTRYDLTIYEQNDHIGGHTNTVVLEENGKTVYIDTGFMVFNKFTYPNLVRLFKELDVQIQPAPMSFSVQHLPTGLEYCGSGLRGLFAQRKNLFSLKHIAMLRQINRFNKECREVLTSPKYAGYSLHKYILEKSYGDDFLEKYLLPMSSAVWSTPPDKMLNFPAASLVRFFDNHGFLGLDSQHQWYTPVHGSQQYREKLIKPFRDRIFPGRGAAKVIREANRVIVRDSNGDNALFDKVIIASHADEALAILDKPTAEESRLLSPFKYQRNLATLHTDASVMPRTRNAWSSWNYRIQRDASGALDPHIIYWMNSLQDVSDSANYFISINGTGHIDPKHIVKQIEYYHPLFTLQTSRAQDELSSLNTSGLVYFCGSYFKYGFHEDAFTSALDLCRSITGEGLWS